MSSSCGRGRVLTRAIGLAATCLLSAALLIGTPAVASGWNQSAAESTLWQLMNGARVNNGLRPVQQNSTLVSLARWRSRDQVQRSYFDHVVLGTSWQVYHWMDLNGLRYKWGGENIGWNNGYSDADSPVAVHNAFMSSPGHRANILEPSWTHGGVGAYAADNVSFLGTTRSPRFYTELFMQALTSSTPSTPPPPPAGPTATPRPPATTVAAHVSSKPAAPERRPVNVRSMVRPTSTAAFDGETVLVSARPSRQALRSLAFMDPWHGPLAAPSAEVAGLRIEAARPADQGFFQNVLGSLLGIFLG